MLEAAARAAADCDHFLAVGTSLQVHPAAGLCEVATRNGAELVIVNADPTPYDHLASRLVRDPIGESLPRPPARARRLTSGAHELPSAGPVQPPKTGGRGRWRASASSARYR